MQPTEDKDELRDERDHDEDPLLVEEVAHRNNEEHDHGDERHEHLD